MYECDYEARDRRGKKYCMKLMLEGGIGRVNDQLSDKSIIRTLVL